VFGISLSQCVANDRLRQMKTAATSSSSPVSTDWEQPYKRSQNGSRNSVSSVFEMPKEDKVVVNFNMFIFSLSMLLLWEYYGEAIADDFFDEGIVFFSKFAGPTSATSNVCTCYCISLYKSFGKLWTTHDGDFSC